MFIATWEKMNLGDCKYPSWSGFVPSDASVIQIQIKRSCMISCQDLTSKTCRQNRILIFVQFLSCFCTFSFNSSSGCAAQTVSAAFRWIQPESFLQIRHQTHKTHTHPACTDNLMIVLFVAVCLRCSDEEEESLFLAQLSNVF